MKLLAVPLLIALTLLSACNRDGAGGPGEKAGKAVDRALEKAGQSIEKAGQNLQDASKGKK